MYCPGTKRLAPSCGSGWNGVEASRHAPTRRTASATARAPDMKSTWRGDDCCDTSKFRSRLVGARPWVRSEEHTSELQSQSNLVCRLLLEKKKQKDTRPSRWPQVGLATP